jgi:hypothetical protein
MGRRRFSWIDTMNSEKAIELEGTIMTVLPGTMFRVALADQNIVLAHISGKMRKRFIRLNDRRSCKDRDVALRYGQGADRLPTLTDGNAISIRTAATAESKVQPKSKKLAGALSFDFKLTDTGRTVEDKLWPTAKVKTQKFRCAHCGGVHSWKKEDVVLGRPAE